MITEYCPMGVIVSDCKKDKRVAKCKESTICIKNFKGDEFRFHKIYSVGVQYIIQM